VSEASVCVMERGSVGFCICHGEGECGLLYVSWREGVWASVCVMERGSVDFLYVPWRGVSNARVFVRLGGVGLLSHGEGEREG
jgi:hypothetical protein